MSESARAAFITAPGPPEAIEHGEVALGPLGPTEVLVRTEALAVNQIDTAVRSGAYATPLPLPFVVGRDLVGTVVRAGAGSTGFAAGDRVWCNSLGYKGRQGSFAARAVVAAERLYPLPAGVDPVEAVATLHPGATAFLGLVRHARIAPGDTVIVGAAAGNVGSCAVQVATACGARVIATARPEDADWVRSLGADVTLDSRDPALGERLREAAPGGADIHWDTSGRHDLDLASAALAQGGRILLTAGRDARPALPVGALYRRNRAVIGFTLSNATIDDLAAAARLLNARLAAGALRCRIATRLPLERTAEAHRLVEGRDGPTPRGRVIVLP